eukprot:3000019-Pyramimonas_sp.AAC.1
MSTVFGAGFRGEPCTVSLYLKKKKLHAHKHSELLADFFDLRWDPLAALPSQPPARGFSTGPGNPRGTAKV